MRRQSASSICFSHNGTEISVAMICQPTQLILHKSKITPAAERTNGETERHRKNELLGVVAAAYSNRPADGRKAECGARGPAAETGRYGQRARTIAGRGAGQGPQGQRQRGAEVSRSQEPRQYLDRPWPHAALDGGRDQGRQGEQGRLPDLTLFHQSTTQSVSRKRGRAFPAPLFCT